MSKSAKKFLDLADEALRGKIRRDAVFQLKITIKGCSPPIWRRVLVPGFITLAQLHRIIQTVFFWTNTHLHAFRIGNRNYGIPSAEDIYPVRNEKKAVLAEEVRREKQRFVYTYDFGDNWDHEIILEKIIEPAPRAVYPRCVAGKRDRPPEDCGGSWGYHRLLNILADPGDPEYEEMKEWVGPYFSPEEWDIELVNSELRKIRLQR